MRGKNKRASRRADSRQASQSKTRGKASDVWSGAFFALTRGRVATCEGALSRLQSTGYLTCSV
jgi:hypothetical protein